MLGQCRSIAEDYPACKGESCCTREKRHGRKEQRTTTVFTISKHQQQWLEEKGWNHIVAVVKVERIREVFDTKRKTWEKSTDESHYISTVKLAAKDFHQAIRQHWGIENKNHHVRDNSMREDSSRIRRNPQIFARLRSFALNIMRFNKVDNIGGQLYKNALSLNGVLKYEGLFDEK